ncbi:MAG: RNA methyltransferase [Myxococcales bacterium]|nr:RNA methyltransferase [Myxococcales bacterium]MCB9534509.1 RNA methyltransferase [Myxococcales bacterium]
MTEEPRPETPGEDATTPVDSEDLDVAFAALAERFTPERIERLRAGVAARMRGLTVVLDGLYDPGNRSAIYRSAEAYGLLDVHVVRPEAAWKEHARSVSRGAEKWLDVHTWRSAGDVAGALHAAGFQLLVADVSNARPLDHFDLSRPTALVFGNERSGASAAMRAVVDGAFTLPMRGFADSFNVSVAAAIAISHARLHRERALGALTDLTVGERDRLLVDFATRSSRWLHRAELETGRRVEGPWNDISLPRPGTE